MTVEFVEKSNTYYSQNFVKAKWFAKVKAVNGKPLKEPIVMEYRSHEKEFEKGSTLTLRAYEDIESFGVNREWEGEGMKDHLSQNTRYGISRFLRVRIPKGLNKSGVAAMADNAASPRRAEM